MTTKCFQKPVMVSPMSPQSDLKVISNSSHVATEVTQKCARVSLRNSSGPSPTEEENVRNDESDEAIVIALHPLPGTLGKDLFADCFRSGYLSEIQKAGVMSTTFLLNTMLLGITCSGRSNETQWFYRAAPPTYPIVRAPFTERPQSTRVFFSSTSGFLRGNCTHPIRWLI